MARHVFSNVPSRLNIDELEAAVAAAAPQVRLIYKPASNWSRYPYRSELLPNGPAQPEYLTDDPPADPSQPYSQPAALIFDNLPENITRQQIVTFLQNHAPTKTDDELREERRAARIDAMLADSATVQDILTRLEALER